MLTEVFEYSLNSQLKSGCASTENPCTLGMSARQNVHVAHWTCSSNQMEFELERPTVPLDWHRSVI